MVECNPFFCFPAEPPKEVGSKGAKGMQHAEMLGKRNNEDDFALPLSSACTTEPGCCILSCLGAPFGFTSWYMRKLVLDTYAGGVNDFVCCQGYIPYFCCVDPRTSCPGGSTGLCLEGLLCPIFSLSIARIHLMDIRRLRPDPMDYQMYACRGFRASDAQIVHP